MTLRIATRGSPLARWQAGRVAQLLGPTVDTELVVVETTGDRSPLPIHAMGGTGVFVREVQAAVLDGRADLAVHSAKDLPSTPTERLTIAAVPERADPRDVLVGTPWAGLRPGARIGTGAIRRRVQLAHARPDLTFGELRGNIETRLRKAADFDAIVVARAALERLDRTDAIADDLDLVPQVGQGTLAVECRVDDPSTIERLAGIDDARLHRDLDTERAFLAAIASRSGSGGLRGCDLPCGAHRDGDVLTVLLGTPDGTLVLREAFGIEAGETATAFGTRAATVLFAEHGGDAILRGSAP